MQSVKTTSLYLAGTVSFHSCVVHFHSSEVWMLQWRRYHATRLHELHAPCADQTWRAGKFGDFPAMFDPGETTQPDDPSAVSCLFFENAILRYQL